MGDKTVVHGAQSKNFSVIVVGDQNMPLGHNNYCELKTFERKQMPKKLSSPPHPTWSKSQTQVVSGGARS